jgi:thiol-disulfide isomerase/thioredoxin
MKIPFFLILYTALTGLALLVPAGRAAEIGEGFSTKAAKAIKKAKAIIKDKGLQPGLKEYEAAAVKLRADFPERPEPWAMLLEVAINLDYQDDQLQPTRTMKASEDQGVKIIDHVRKLLAKINKSTVAHETTKERARQELARLTRLGKPLALEFDNALSLDLKSKDPVLRQVPFQIKDHRGKVVLVHFWSTQSGPCIADLPRLKQERTKYADDLVTVGISLDENRARLDLFLKENQMDWPQHFDKRGWDNHFADEFGITSIPTQWLIDRQGNLRALNARHNLEKKIAVLANEKAVTKTTDNNATTPETDEKTGPKGK